MSKPSLSELIEYAEEQVVKEGTEREAVLRASTVSTLRGLRENAAFLRSAFEIRKINPTAFEALRAFPEAQVTERTTQ